jgi:fatty-acyl-CoA synthase
MDGPLDAKALSAYVAEALPPYAQPVFVRVLPAMETTGTFKIRKMDLVADGYDPARVKGPLFFLDPKRGYVRVTRLVHEKIASGAVRV